VDERGAADVGKLTGEGSFTLPNEWNGAHMKVAMLVVLTSVVAATPQSAQALRPVSLERIAPRADVTHAGPDTARVRAMLATGDSLESVGHFAAARRQYRLLIDAQRAADQYPAEGLWHLANSYFNRGDAMQAASTLDELASAAAGVGDPVWELRATLEAALIYEKHRDGARVGPRLDRVRALLRSPVIPDAVKEAVEGRLAKRTGGA
jgi:hypothetical protein